MQTIQSHRHVQAAWRLKLLLKEEVLCLLKRNWKEKYLVMLIIPTHDVKGEGTAQQICLKYCSAVIIYQKKHIWHLVSIWVDPAISLEHWRCFEIKTDILDSKSDRQDALLTRPLSVDSVPPLLGLKHVWQRIYASRASRFELPDKIVSKTIGHTKKQDGTQDRFYMKNRWKSSDFSLALSNNQTETFHASKNNHHKTSCRPVSDRQHSKWKLICKNEPGSSASE